MTSSTGVMIESFTAQERAATVTWLIATGAELTTSEIAQRLGVTWHGAYYLMCNVSRVVPVTQERGRWRRFDAV